MPQQCVRTIRTILAASVLAVVLPGGTKSTFADGAAVPPTTVPANAKPQRQSYALAMSRSAHYSEVGKKINAGWDGLIHAMLDNKDDVFDPAKRPGLLAQVKPIATQLHLDAEALVAQEGDQLAKGVLAMVDDKCQEYLALLDDPETMKAVQADIDGPDVAKAMRARSRQFNMRWTLAEGDKAKQAEILDSIETLAKQHPDSPDLANAIHGFMQKSADSDTRDRLGNILSGTMTKDATAGFSGIVAILNGQRATQANIGRAFALTGKTADGKDFTTADWKGKVVLVDFWATWCGPCVAELPGIQKLYADYHDKGLEIVGVSNDFKLEDLQTFTAKKQMPWPQLFNPDAAAKRTWNPVTLAHGVMGIPRLFVIDRKGNLLTDKAGRDNFKDIVAKAIAE